MSNHETDPMHPQIPGNDVLSRIGSGACDTPGLATSIHKGDFLELFPEPCQKDCIVAKAAAARAARQVIELGITFEKATEILAHRFGRCALGRPTLEGLCQTKSICNNELVAQIENPTEAAEILATL